MTLTFYNQNSELYVKSTLEADLSAQYEKFLPLVKKEGLILDVGCGSGRDSLYFKNHGYQVIALDGSYELAKKASVLLNQPVEHMLFEDIKFENQFDAIWACASLLHVPLSDMLEIVNKLEKSLKHDGIMFISVKEGVGCEVSNERFFQYYSVESFCDLVIQNPRLSICDIWKSSEIRDKVAEVTWISGILKKI